MPRFTSGRYPQMRVNTATGPVQFVDGTAEATPAQARVLRAMPDEYELTEVKTERAPAADPKPDESGGE